MIVMKNFISIIILALLTMCSVSCIEDGVSTSSSDQPTFSVDTLNLGSVFTGQGTPTHRFVVYNRHDKIININTIALRNDASGVFRLNVDGMSGRTFSNVEIRPNDSIYVFVEATAPVNGTPGLLAVEDHLDFTTQGVTRSVVLHADGFDVEPIRSLVITQDSRMTAEYPYQVWDSIVVEEGAKLIVDPGVKLYFHDKAEFIVRGTLEVNGTAEQPVEMMGDRLGNVVTTIPFELLASQWEGLFFTPSSKGNKLSHTSIRNTSYGVVADSLGGSMEAPNLYMLNCQLHNSGTYVFQAAHTGVTAIGCEFSDASLGVIYVRGGELTLNHCTIANYYLFTALGGPSLQLAHVTSDDDDASGLPFLKANIDNTIVYGNGTDLSHGDLEGSTVLMRSCLLKSAGSDDNNFINCLWDTDPLYFTVREDYYFDYRLKEDSPARGAADTSLTLPAAAYDRYGTSRAATIGAYE